MTQPNQVIETTAGEIAAELARRGVRPDAPVTVTIDPETTGSRPESAKLAEIAARMRATAAAQGLTTEIFDALLAQP